RDVDERFQLKILFQRCAVPGAAGQHLYPKLAHLVGGLLPELNPTRRMTWITWIGIRVIVSVLHRNLRPFWQENRLAVTVVALPVEIPLFDEKKPLPRPVGQQGVAFHFLSQ